MTLELIIAAVVVFLVITSLFGRRNGGGYVGTSLVIVKPVEFDDTNLARLVSLNCRKTGLIARILSLINPRATEQYCLDVNSRYVEVRVEGPFSQRLINIPVHEITAVYSSYARPKWALFLGLGLAAFGVFSLLFSRPVYSYNSYYSPGLLESILGANGIVVLIIALIVLFFLWWRNRTIELRVSNGDAFWGFDFKDSGQETYNHARSIVMLVNYMITMYARNEEMSDLRIAELLALRQ